MRIRQVALVARALAPVTDALRAVLGLGEPFHDEGVGVFGLCNSVLALGDQFLEVVSPVRDDVTAARFLARRGGDGGYMVILQTEDDLETHRARLAAHGVRVVWEVALPDIATIHLHPRDLGGAIVSLDRPLPARSWRWAGPGWEEKGAASDARRIVGVDLQSDEPEALARRWAEALGLAPPERDGAAFRLGLEGGDLAFHPLADDRGPGVAALRLTIRDPQAARRRAEERGLVDDAGRVRIGGMRLDLAADEPGTQPAA